MSQQEISKKDLEFSKNIRTRTINEIHNIRNNKKIVKKLGAKINDLGQWFRVQVHSVRKGTKRGTSSKLQVRYKNERTVN